MHKEFEKYAAEYKTNIGELADSKYYANLARATGYIERNLRKVWAPLAKQLDNEDDPIAVQLSMAPTDILVVHFYAAGLLRFGTKKTNAPELSKFVPIFDDVADMVRFGVRAVAKVDLARVIGKGKSAVDDSIRRLRHGNKSTDAFYEKKLAVPLFVPTGIMLDVATSMQCSFPSEDYAYAKRHAEVVKIHSAPTLLRQTEYCAFAMRSLATPKHELAEVTRTGSTAERGMS